MSDTQEARIPGDIYARVTQQIIESLENATPWTRPWTSANDLPANVWTGKRYRGVNVLALWATAAANAYRSAHWATFRQWKALGAKIRRGEKATFVVFWNFVGEEDSENESAKDKVGGQVKRSAVLARSYPVFNEAQVEGFKPTTPVNHSGQHWTARAKEFISAQQADIRHGRDRAFYHPGDDFIGMPDRDHFRDAAAHFSTLAHELTHWSGARSRLNRDLTARFGSDAYAMEELVAELGAAFLCASLGVSADPRLDHASYIKNWLEVLRRDKTAIFTAASKAQEASDWMQARSTAEQIAA